MAQQTGVGDLQTGYPAAEGLLQPSQADPLQIGGQSRKWAGYTRWGRHAHRECCQPPLLRLIKA
ncbi:hypothetical protein D3C81_2139720 [compost metagenome]